MYTEIGKENGAGQPYDSEFWFSCLGFRWSTVFEGSVFFFGGGLGFGGPDFAAGFSNFDLPADEFLTEVWRRTW